MLSGYKTQAQMCVLAMQQFQFFNNLLEQQNNSLYLDLEA